MVRCIPVYIKVNEAYRKEQQRKSNDFSAALFILDFFPF